MGFTSYSLLVFMYKNDGGDIAYALIPSLHCSISLYCCLGIRGQKNISRGFRIYSWIGLTLIILSTLFTKQHYFLDTIGGCCLALLVYFIVEIINPGKQVIKHNENKSQTRNKN